MSSHQHQSPVLIEQSVSPPHLLSPELQPINTMASPRPETAQVEGVAEPEAPTMNTSTETNSYAEQSTDAEGARSEATTMPEPDSANIVPQTSVAEAVAGDERHTSNTLPEPSDSESIPAEHGLGETQDLSQAVEMVPGNDRLVERVTEISPETQSTPSVAGDTPEPQRREVNIDSENAPPAPPPLVDNTPSWVQYEEDTSTPDEEEMKEIVELEADKPDASDILAMEDQLFPSLDDPEQRPCKKLRMSWVINGIRGTREKPNMAKVMNSPAVCVDGLYWSIKFYPRGDNCASLSAFVRCSRIPPRQLEEMPEHTFSFFEGPPDADFTKEYEPTVQISAPNTLKLWEKPKPAEKDSRESSGSKKPADNEDEAANARSWTPPPEDDDPNDGNDDTEYKDVQDWRVSAQLGMSIYNPAEPRTNTPQSDGHQFSKNCDDWGWVNFVGPWTEVHKRKRGQRRPLLQDDRLAIDAYIRIYHDPTEALWWHESKNETQWPSKQLAGFFPMGTPALYHSPAVAAITAWTLLSPFRKLIQSHDGYQWRKDSSVPPTPLICSTQLVLHQMRSLVGESYVSVYKIIEELIEADEAWEDVKSFWEVYRRGLELEFKDDLGSLKALSDIFDAAGNTFPMPTLPVADTNDVASGLGRYFDKSGFKGSLPDFMPVMLNRQEFDKVGRQWKLHHNRVRLDDELDLTNWCSDDDAQYTLYGFVVHVGLRNSGKFYTVLRPGGVGSKWLAFEDGNGNKVFSYTKKRIQEFEGLEGDELKAFSGDREKAYMAMYVRTSCWDEYLPKEMEAFVLPRWLRSWVEGSVEVSEEVEKEEIQQSQAAEQAQSENGIEVEIYLDECVNGRENMLELHDLRSSAEARKYRQTVMVATDKTFAVLRSKIAEALEIPDVSKVAVWEIGYRNIGRYQRAELETVSWRRRVKRQVQPGEVFLMWLTILPHDGKKDSYQDLLHKIGDMDLDKKTPESPPVEEATEEVKPDVNASEGPEESTTVVELPEDGSTNRTVETSSSHTEDSTASGGVATPATGDTGDSAVDLEQTSVQDAVSGDIQSVLDTRPTSPEQLGVASGESLESQTASTSTTTVVPVSDEALPVSAVQETSVEHGHLVEAVEAVPQSSETDSTLPIDGVDLHGLARDDVISAEDVAAIAALLAADAAENAAAAAAEQSDEPTNDDQGGPEADAENTAVEPEREAEVVQNRSITPEPLHVYGFLHVFDADEQKFVAKTPFGPIMEHEIGPSVQKALGYPEDKEIRIWRREGPTGTSPITNSSTFASSNLGDGFVLIVGETLSETKVDALKQIGKFWQPAKLIKHLSMTRRGHPVLSKTSSDPIEISDFGGDYFKGPLINGQPHGDSCTLITASCHTYEGSLVAGLKSGPKGKMTYSNGDVYIGDWLNDERHGNGELVEARTGNRYVGGFENGKKWGEGVTYWKVADEQARMCQICYGEEIDALFFDCGHVCACMECAERQRDNGCPICRKPVRQVVKMFPA